MKLAQMPVFWIYIVAVACGLLSVWTWPDSHVGIKWLWSGLIVIFSTVIIGAMNE